MFQLVWCVLTNQSASFQYEEDTPLWNFFIRLLPYYGMPRLDGLLAESRLKSRLGCLPVESSLLNVDKDWFIRGDFGLQWDFFGVFFRIQPQLILGVFEAGLQCRVGDWNPPPRTFDRLLGLPNVLRSIFWANWYLLRIFKCQSWSSLVDGNEQLDWPISQTCI